MRVTFFCFAKRKSPKKRRPPVCDPFAARRGKPAAGRLRGAPWNSLCAARAARTATASQFTKHGRSDAHAHPATAPPQAQPAGAWTAEQPNSHTGHRFARPRDRGAQRLRVRGRAQRWPVWMSDSRVPFRMRRGAQRPADQGSRLFERSEFERDPAGREHRRLPAAKRRDAACRVAFSLVTFSWRGKRKLLRRRAHTPASALRKGMGIRQCRASTSSARKRS